MLDSLIIYHPMNDPYGRQGFCVSDNQLPAQMRRE